jgi:diaminohydroxyphosphoribosylaminopyrimidine deaminase/5-amino-6-(5-phosphoribosylamino)uracil reductase
MASTVEHAAMRHAIVLSAHGLGTTSPNPPVGCVILDASGNIVGEGYHHRKGEPHAETLALAAAGERARGGTAVVTLEPRNHRGRTPPCRQALIDAGVARVVIALLDPTSRGEGGAAVLRHAGIDVESGVLAEEADLVLGPWMRTLNTRRPVLWWATTSGPTAPHTDWRAGLRSRMDALIHTDGRITEAAPDSHGTGILDLPHTHDPNHPQATVRALFDGGARTVLLDAERTLAAPFLHHDLVDHLLIAHTGPALGAAGRALTALPDGFVLDRVTKEADTVIVQGQRTTSLETRALG